MLIRTLVTAFRSSELICAARVPRSGNRNCQFLLTRASLQRGLVVFNQQIDQFLRK